MEFIVLKEGNERPNIDDSTVLFTRSSQFCRDLLNFGTKVCARFVMNQKSIEIWLNYKSILELEVQLEVNFKTRFFCNLAALLKMEV